MTRHNRPLTGQIITLLLLTLGWCTPGQAAPPPKAVRNSIGHLGPVPVPEDNPLSAAKVALGKRLFSDNRLSADSSVSCQTCHLPDHGFAVPQPLGPAYPSQRERRNSPALVNVAYNSPLIWDGRAPNLDKQALGPVKNVLHMNNNVDLLVEQLKASEDYRGAFRGAYGDSDITGERIAAALASFERTLVFDDSPLDRYMAGDRTALDAVQTRGLELFFGKARCIQCHLGPNLTDNLFHNLGVPDQAVANDPQRLAAIRFDAKRMGLEGWATLEHDPGREAVTKDPADRGKFRTMGLRNIESSAPYMHNGALATLEDVVAFYNRGGGDRPNKSPLIEPLGLTDDESRDLVAFLRALTGTQRDMELP
ncbi:MAG: cytochrome c peroxidase [Gammaproteobacteria bacterium]|jgi:cytochrome c peroxidase